MTSAVAAAREKSFADFDKALSDFGRNLPVQQLSLVVRKLALEGLRRVVKRTPVDTGRARANWQVSIGAPAEGVLAGFDKSGAGAVAAGSAVIESIAKPGGGGYVPTVWISNNLPYALVLEEGGYPSPPKNETGKTKGGYSVQAPRGMVAVTVQELLQVFAKEDSSQ